MFCGKMSEILHITNTSQGVYYHTLGKANTPPALFSPNYFILLLYYMLKKAKQKKENGKNYVLESLHTPCLI